MAVASFKIPKAEAVSFLKNKRPCASFIAVNGYRAKTTGELSDFQVIMNVDYERILNESLTTLKGINSVVVEDKIYSSRDEVFKKAKEEIELSIRRSLDEDNELGQKRAEHFIPISKGVKIARKDGKIYLTGIRHRKHIRQVGEYKEVKSAEKTKVKKAIENQLPKSKYRTFVLDDNFESIALETERFTESDFYEDIR